MKPHLLKMIAFGPFAQEAVVDFDRLGDSIYLIAGKTGSGKTTIFDAMIFALYGEASGDARTRLDIGCFHSDYCKHAGRNDEMRVELSFSNGGHRYTVERRVFWGKGGKAQKASREQILKENGEIIVASKHVGNRDDVTNKIVEIIGLNAQQFRRIIMLAQGEFKKFLEADSIERGDILGKLYDNSRHKDMQNRLKAAKKEIENRYNQLHENEKLYWSGCIWPEKNKSQLEEGALPSLADLDEVIGDMSVQHEATLAEKKSLEAKKSSIEQEQNAGQEHNKRLDKLEAAAAEMKSLKGKAETSQLIRNKVDIGTKAERVLPFESALNKVLAAMDDNKQKCESLGKDLTLLDERYRQLEKKRIAEEKPLQDKQERCNSRIALLESIMPAYEAYSDAINAAAEADAQKKGTEDKAAECQKRLSDLKGELELLEKKLTGLSDANEETLKAATSAVETQTERYYDFNNLNSQLNSFHNAKSELLELQRKELSAKMLAHEKEQAHFKLNGAFIAGQAVLLANELKKQLEQEDSVICPVCGSVHVREDASDFAQDCGNVPAKADVDEALKEWYKARRDAEAASGNVTAAKSRLDEQLKTIEQAGQRLLSINNIELLLAGNTIEKAIDGCLTEKKRLEAKAAELADRIQQRQKAQKTKIQKQLDLEQAEKALQQADESDRAAAQAVIAAKEKHSAAAKQLEGFPATKVLADAELNDCRIQAKTIKSELDELLKSCNDCRVRLSEVQGKLKALQEASMHLKEDAKVTEENYRAALSKEGFADTDSYILALSPEGFRANSQELREWLEKMENGLKTYEEKLKSTEAEIKHLTEETAGRPRLDMEAIGIKLKEVNKQLEQLDIKEHQLAADINRNRSARHQLEKSAEKRQLLGRALDRIRPLSDAANGRLAFSRYVLESYFKSILEQANVHFETLTGGEFSFVAEETGDGRTARGLGLKIQDAFTGTVRETATLSGGQSFAASLSLALGLSEAVQLQSTGAVQLDCMFIDEGFGSLDAEVLDSAVAMLSSLSGGRRQIGIISHVARLDECIPKKIRVASGNGGSRIWLDVDE